MRSRSFAYILISLFLQLAILSCSLAIAHLPSKSYRQNQLGDDISLVPFAIQHFPTNVTDVLPYIVKKSTNEGLLVRFPQQTEAANNFRQRTSFQHDFALSTLEEASSLRTRESDSLSEIVEWQFIESRASMTAPLVMSAPYVTAMYSHVTPLVSTPHAIVALTVDSEPTLKSRELRNETKVIGSRFSLELADGSVWLLYSSTKISLQLYCEKTKCTQLTALRKMYKGYFRLAVVIPSTQADSTKMLPATKQLNELVLDEYAHNIPLGAFPHFDEKRQEVHVQWLTAQNNENAARDLLMVAVQREIDHMTCVQDAGVLYHHHKRPLYGVIAAEWQLKDN